MDARSKFLSKRAKAGISDRKQALSSGSFKMKPEKTTLLNKLPYVCAILFLALVFCANSQALAGVNLEVPLEMIDRGISSHNTATRTHKRSSIYFNIAEYDGDTVNYYFEIVANNTNTTTAQNVYLRDQTNGVDRVTVPVSAGAVRVRFRFPFTPVAGNNEYRMKIDATPTGVDQIQVFAARIIVVQTNATKTRIQIPLLNHGFNGFYNGTGAATDTLKITTYSQNAETRFSLWHKDFSAWGDLAATNPWTFEAVTRNNPSGTSYVSLFNKTDNTQVTDTEVSTTGTTMTLLSRDFIDSAANFHDLDDFEARHRHSTGGTVESRLARAALYVRLTNLNMGEVYWRFGRKNEVSNNATNNQQRVMLTTDNYSNPQVYHETTGWESTSGVVNSAVLDAGTTDSGQTGTVIANSIIEFDSTSKAVQRSTTDLMPDITSGNRYIRQITRTSGTIVCASNWLVVKFSTGGCTTPGTPSNPIPADGVTNVSIDADLSWDPCTDTDSYEVYFGESSKPPYVGTTTGITYPLSTNEYCTKYYWKIVAKNDAGCSTTGDVWDFTTENGPPGTPSSPDPLDGAIDVSTNAVLDWSDCTGTDTYEVYLDENPTPTTLVGEPADSTFNPTLDFNTHYYWKIVAKNSCGSSTASAIWDFTTGSGTSHYVDGDRGNDGDAPYGSPSTPAETIQAAIDVCVNGTVYVKKVASAYGNIDMKTNVHIVGTDETGGVPASRDDYPTLYRGPEGFPDIGGAPVRLFGPLSNCRLAYFKITGGKMEEGQIYVCGVGGEITNDVVIEKCWLSEGSHVGIMLRGAAAPTIKDCDIEDPISSGISSYRYGLEPASTPMVIKGCSLSGSGSGRGLRAGIRLAGNGGSGVQVTIGGSDVGDSNTVSNHGYAGIRIDDIDQFSIENNDISNNGRGGILLVDSSTVSPHVKNNDIHNHVNGAGINIGGASTVTIGDNNDIYSNLTGIAFYVSNNGNIGKTKSSQPVTITGNNIYSNSEAGIGVRDGIDGSVTTITQNNIYSNSQAGIRMQRKCKLDINRNDIHENLRGGIHTGSDVADGGGFNAGHIGFGLLTIEKNKIYGNGSGGYGAGIDVRHMPGTIYNNLVYNNYKGGIRFGDYITEIINNTVVGNGNATGGGIAYDDLAGAVNANAAGVPPAPFPEIKNNISAYNVTAGIRACFDNTGEERDYNLVYSNNGTGATDCGWPDSINMRCANKNFGGCGGKWNLPGPPKILPDGANNNIADPLFVEKDDDDYQLQSGSPAEGAGDDDFDMGAYGGSDPLDW